MANELSVLDQDISVDYKVGTYDFKNYEQLESAVKQVVDRYTNLVVTPATFKDDKKAKAQINSLKKKLNDSRISIKREMMAPIDEFESKVKALTNDLDSVVDPINKGIKEYENKLKQDKHNLNIAAIQKWAEQTGVDAANVEYNPKWDNSSYKATDFEKEVRQQLEQVQRDQELYEQNKKAIGQRASELGLASNSFVDMLDYKELAEIFSSMTKAKEETNALKKREIEMAKARKAAEQATTEVKGNKVIEKETGEVKAQLYKIHFDVIGTEKELRMLLDYLDDQRTMSQTFKYERRKSNGNK